MKWNGKLNKKYTQISAYVIVTAVIIYVLSLVAKNAPDIMDSLLRKIGWLVTIIKPIIIGFVIAYLFEPVIAFFQRSLERSKYYKNKPRKARFHSVMITVLIAVLTIVALISVLVWSISKQIRLANIDDVIEIAKIYVGYFTEFINRLIEQLKELNIETKEFQQVITNITSKLGELVSTTVNTTAGSLGNITSVMTTFLFSVIIGVWFMIDGAMMTNYLNKVMFALVDQKTNKRVHNFLHDADEVFSGYIRGQLMDAFVMMCLISISLSMVGVKFSVVIGVLAGFGNLIPYLGPFIAYACTVVVCVINGEFRTLLVAMIVLVIIQAIDGNFIGPKLLSKSIEVHPLLVIISLIFGSAVGGFLGMLLAVPVGALIKVLFVRYIDNKAEKKSQDMEREKSIEQAVMRAKQKNER